MVSAGSHWFNRRSVVGVFVGVVFAALGLRASAHLANAFAGAGTASVADSNGFVEPLELVVAPPGPVQYGCCIRAENRCEYPMVVSECKRAGGYLVRGCGQCPVLRLTDLDPSLESETDGVDASAPVVNP